LRLYGIRQGGNRKSKERNLDLKSQSDLANDLGFSQKQLQDYKKLTTLIPELQNLIQNGSLSATTGYKIWAKMSPEEQTSNKSDLKQKEVIYTSSFFTSNFNTSPISHSNAIHIFSSVSNLILTVSLFANLVIV